MASAERRPERAGAEESTRGIDLHADDAHAATGGLDQHGLGERQPMDVGHIERDQHGIEVEPAHGFEQDGRVVVPGQAEEPDAPFLTRLDERLERAAAAEDRLQVAGRAQVVELPEVQVVGAQLA